VNADSQNAIVAGGFVGDRPTAFSLSRYVGILSRHIHPAQHADERIHRLGSSVPTDWGIALNGATPAHTIIGPAGSGGYTNADGSIAGNGPHNPSLDRTATFTLDDISARNHGWTGPVSRNAGRYAGALNPCAAKTSGH
jgi:hypothetical protein